eukprot:CAMPEP_0113515218 /NCGR_PEP_ID=MMETSP0014_2-20120614/40824_1 /TAXON_ID=2857 /ORGANISM="Nitzschia sp." /LENGTH=605 /DNA_ID=CAMNT_0000411765 /DNA_START=192 /DNA_END=2009 /DNA_ORIENTATION=+ /assembly_acc=CAM_ASM_000159
MGNRASSSSSAAAAAAAAAAQGVQVETSPLINKSKQSPPSPPVAANSAAAAAAAAAAVVNPPRSHLSVSYHDDGGNSSHASSTTATSDNIGATTDTNGGGDKTYGAATTTTSLLTQQKQTNYSQRITASFRRSAESFSEAMLELKRIGYLGSMAIAVNSLTGPAMLNLPDTYQRAGLIPTTVVIIFVCILSALCCLHMSNTISKVSGNSRFIKDIGYSECFKEFWGSKSYVYTQVLFYCCILCLNVSSIVDTAQVIDTILGHWLPDGSAAVSMNAEDDELVIQFVKWDYSSCTEDMLVSGECVPFYEEDGILFTAGYGLTLLFFMPMALMDLKENAAMQVIGYLVLLAASFIFVVLFVLEGINFDNISLWGTDWGSLFGVVLFNFALVIAVPAWLYEKEESVKVPVVVHSSSVLSAILYVLIGVLGAITMPFVSPNMLESMMSGAFGMPMQVTASVFAFFIIGLGAPLFSVLTRMNLTCNDLLSHGKANILAVHIPFLMSWMFYQGDAITQLLSWGGIIFTSLIAFILPLLISLHSLSTSDREGSIDVYYPLHCVKSKSAQKAALRVLLVLSVLSIIFAILGNVFNDDLMQLAAWIDQQRATKSE